MSRIVFDQGTLVRIDGTNCIEGAMTPTVVGSCCSGVDAVKVEASKITGVVTMVGSGATTVTAAGKVVTISTPLASSRLTELTDVIVATDADGNCVEPNDSFLVFNNDSSNALDGFWSATRTLDGGGYA